MPSKRKPSHFLQMQQTDVRAKEFPMNGNNAIPSTTKSRHAPMPIYRPPSLRDGAFAIEDKGRLNVHAKEFVMSNGSPKNSGTHKYGYSASDNFRSSVKFKDSSKIDKSFPLNLSKSNGSIALGPSKPDSSQFSYKHIPNGIASGANSIGYNLQRTKSIGDVLSNNASVGSSSSKVQFKSPLYDKNNNGSGLTSPSKDKKFVAGAAHPSLGSLKRSKSLGAADALKLMEAEASLAHYSAKFTEYHLFPTKMHDFIQQAVQTANKMSDKDKIVLARLVVEHAIKDSKYSLPASKLCAIIMEKDKSGAFSDSLVNTCQMLYEKKETSFTGDSKFTSFLAFLTEIFSELKRSKLQIKMFSDPITPPKITLLILISRCCEDILLKKETHSLREIECLFMTMTSLGRDMENELPAMFKRLFSILKVVFLKGSNEQQIQKTFLQLIELRAANWQLPVSALNYYYPKSSN